MIALAPFPFERWAKDHGYDAVPAVLPAPNRTYADRDAQAVFDAWNARGSHFARMLTESTLETEALRDRRRNSSVGR